MVASVIGIPVLAGNGDSVMTKVKYYEMFGGYDHPVKLIGEIKEAEASARRTYIKATYENNLLLEVEKYLDGKIFFTYRYTYSGGKLDGIYITNDEQDTKFVKP
ncbi:DUF6156 family protein [Aquabacterium sp. A7-Y]|uniref:DUF6156 family protein n=1 Tax=Aquabacterium sp. A7-Y TaxID=1349605 RepID=UPI00223E8BD8|nr:DUF6156 family protein [Aquabacterium sp. A7-Y]MCW7540673.1 DUF6156 family protein [Aquabacterium sp. A7-Y]